MSKYLVFIIQYTFLYLVEFGREFLILIHCRARKNKPSQSIPIEG